MENGKIGNFCNAEFGSKFSLIGYPDDLAVKNVNGRVGASQGPGKFFEYFAKLKGDRPLQSACFRQGEPKMGPDLAQNYLNSIRMTEAWCSELLLKKDALIGIGGGHDYAYPWMAGVRKALPKPLKLGCINLDAHFDLREYAPLMTSGSPFRRLIDEKVIDPRNLIEFGIQNHCNSSDLWAYAKSKKIPVVPYEKLRNGRAVGEFKNALNALKKRVDVVLVSLDLDSVSASVAPGVSAPQPEGFSASELYQMLECAGQEPKVFSLGIFELAPPLDSHDLTSRLAAQSAWKFLRQKIKLKESKR